MDETVLQPFATIYAAAYAASRERASLKDDARREAGEAVRDFIRLLEDVHEEERVRPKRGSGGKG